MLELAGESAARAPRDVGAARRVRRALGLGVELLDLPALAPRIDALRGRERVSLCASGHGDGSGREAGLVAGGRRLRGADAGRVCRRGCSTGSGAGPSSTSSSRSWRAARRFRWSAWRRAAWRSARRFARASGSTPASYGSRALDFTMSALGIDRMLFGSDAPIVDPALTVLTVQSFGQAVTRRDVHDESAATSGQMSDIEGFVHEHVPGGRPLDRAELAALARTIGEHPSSGARTSTTARTSGTSAALSRSEHRHLADLLGQRAGHRLPRPRSVVGRRVRLRGPALRGLAAARAGRLDPRADDRAPRGEGFDFPRRTSTASATRAAARPRARSTSTARRSGAWATTSTRSTGSWGASRSRTPTSSRVRHRARQARLRRPRQPRPPSRRQPGAGGLPAHRARP